MLGAALGAPVLWYLQDHGLDLGGATGEVISLAGVVVGHFWYGRQDFPAYSQAAAGTRRDGAGLCALSGLASRALPADGSDSQGLAVTSFSYWRKSAGAIFGAILEALLLTALALGLGLALLLISLGLLDGGHEQTIADGVRFGPGHVVIEAKGYQDIKLSTSCCFRRKWCPRSRSFCKRRK